MGDAVREVVWTLFAYGGCNKGGSSGEVNCVNCNGENVVTTNLNLIHFFNIQNCNN
jgi:hypothetical protein